MTKAKFEIGETEKHTIIVNASALLKYIKIEVDGEKVVNEANFQPWQRSSSWTWEIPKSIIWKSALDRSRLSNYSWTEKKLKKPESASLAQKVEI